jgi:hypothetical protein
MKAVQFFADRFRAHKARLSVDPRIIVCRKKPDLLPKHSFDKNWTNVSQALSI